MTKTITLFKEADGQWASRFNFRENIDLDIVVTELSMGYITSITVIRGEYKDGCVFCDSLDEYDVCLYGESTGTVSTIHRNSIKLRTEDRPVRVVIYKFEFRIVYEE